MAPPAGPQPAYPAPPYQFKLPIAGTAITWTPMTVGVEMDIEAAYGDARNRHLQKYALIAKRIRKWGDKPFPIGMEPHELRDWESDDVAALWEEMQEREAARKAAFTKPAAGPSNLVQRVEAAVANARTAVLMLQASLPELIAAARDAEAAGASSTPLPG